MKELEEELATQAAAAKETVSQLQLELETCQAISKQAAAGSGIAAREATRLRTQATASEEQIKKLEANAEIESKEITKLRTELRDSAKKLLNVESDMEEQVCELKDKLQQAHVQAKQLQRCERELETSKAKITQLTAQAELDDTPTEVVSDQEQSQKPAGLGLGVKGLNFSNLPKGIDLEPAQMTSRATVGRAMTSRLPSEEDMHLRSKLATANSDLATANNLIQKLEKSQESLIDRIEQLEIILDQDEFEDEFSPSAAIDTLGPNPAVVRLRAELEQAQTKEAELAVRSLKAGADGEMAKDSVGSVGNVNTLEPEIRVARAEVIAEGPARGSLVTVCAAGGETEVRAQRSARSTTR